jgi:hypothetical protein
MTTITQMCTMKTLVDLEIMRRPVTARKLGFVHLVEQSKQEIKTVPALNYNDMAVAEMEAARRPRAVARMKKLKKLNVITK